MKKTVAALTAAVLAASITAGCGSVRFGSINVGSGLKGDVLMKIGDEKISAEEGAYYLDAWLNSYAKEYGRQPAASALSEEEKTAAAGYVEDAILASRSCLAEKEVLPENMTSVIDQAASQYLAENKDADEDVLKAALTGLYMADQKYSDIIGSDISVSEDEARVVSVRQIRLSYTDDASRTEQKKKADDIIGRLQEGKKYFQEQASHYSDSDEILNMVTRGEFSSETESAIYALAAGEFTAVQEDGNAYWIFQCLAETSEPETSQHMTELKEEKAEGLFKDTLKAFADAQEAKWNDAAWEQLIAEEPSYSGSGFYQIYEGAVYGN